MIRVTRLIETSSRFIIKRSLSSVQAREKIPDKDIFGTLSRSGKQSLAVAQVERYYPDDKDGYDKEEYDLDPRKHAFYYKYEISNNARKGKLGLRKALELFAEMKSKARLTPTLDNFSPLIYGCSRAGYIKRAFELYKELLKYYDKPTKSNVTSLINACAESPFPEYGLKKLDWFLEHLKFEYNYSYSLVHYNCIIKAYGKLGRLDQASKVLQEMIEAGHMPKVSTFTMLLIGCRSNKEAGALLALKIFKRLKYYNVKPDIHIYHQLLGCIRDCGLGSAEMLRQTIAELPALVTFDKKLSYKKYLNYHTISVKEQRLLDFEWLPQISDVGKDIFSIITKENGNAVPSEDLSKVDKTNCDNIVRVSQLTNLIAAPTPSSAVVAIRETPNLLSDDHIIQMSTIEAIDFEKTKRVHNRLQLFGGMHGFFKTMVDDGLQPNVIMFNLILNCLKPTPDVLTEYFRLSKDYNIERSILFYDQLIRHLCSNYKLKDRHKLAMNFLEEMQRDGIRPNITTFEALVLGCDYWVNAEKLIQDVTNCGFVLSGAFIRRIFKIATMRSDFYYLAKVIDVAIKEKYHPIPSLIEELECKRIEVHDMILLDEKGLLKKKPEYFNESYIVDYDRFCKKFSNWLKTVDIDEEEHPWKQFEVNTTAKVMGFREFQNKFKTMEKLKQEAIKSGKEFGNLAAKANLLSE